jgi:hypothetical protein
MIRKLIENLIIDVYDNAKKQAEIQQNGEYLMLSGLITAILNQNHWMLQRETKRSLPDIKKLGDRAAHNRRPLGLCLCTRGRPNDNPQGDSRDQPT